MATPPISPGWVTQDGSSSLSYTAPAGSDRVLVVAIWGRRSGSNAPITATAITWGGVALNFGEDAFYQGGGSRLACEIWYLLEADWPSGGTGTITVTWSATPDVDEGLNVATYGSIGAFNSAIATANTVTSQSTSVAVPHAASGATLVTSAISAGGAVGPMSFTNADERLDFDTAVATALRVGAADAAPASGTSTTIAVTTTGSAAQSAWAMVGISFDEPVAPVAPTEDTNYTGALMQPLISSIGLGLGV